MTEREPQSPDPRRLRNTVLLWGGLSIVICAAWAFERYSRGYTVWQVFAGVHWLWVLAGIAAVMGLGWVVTRLGSPTPEMKQVLLRFARERAVCRHCGHPREAQDLTCRSCGRVVGWAELTGAGLFALMLLGLLVLGIVL